MYQFEVVEATFAPGHTEDLSESFERLAEAASQLTDTFRGLRESRSGG